MAGWLTWSFLTNYDSRHPENAGVIAGLWGSFWLVSLATLLTVPIGVGAAIFLEEYQTKGWLRTLIEVNLSNLAGVPSIVYGILGMAVFVKMFGVFQHDPQLLELSLGFTSVEIPLPFGRTVLSGAMTLALLMLPVVIVASREALRAIPPSIRHASYALGATHWQTIRHVVLPVAVPGIVTGVILAVARAAGDRARAVLEDAILRGARAGVFAVSPDNPHDVILAAFSAWSAVHGLTMLVIDRIPKAELALDDIMDRLLRMIAAGLRKPGAERSSETYANLDLKGPSALPPSAAVPRKKRATK